MGLLLRIDGLFVVLIYGFIVLMCIGLLFVVMLVVIRMGLGVVLDVM